MERIILIDDEHFGTQENPMERTTKNRLTVYALACGAVEQYEYDGLRITLGRFPGTKLYFVRIYDFMTHKHLVDKTFEKISSAREYYDVKVINGRN